MSARAGRAAALLAPFALSGLCAACGPSLHQARRTADEPPSEAEERAAAAPPGSGCNAMAGALVPGLGQLCSGRTAEGAAVMALGAAELGTGIAVALKHDVTYPGAAVPLLAFSDLVLYQSFSQVLERQRAYRVPLVPPEALGDLVAAPFNANVLGKTEVWAGILGSVAAGVLVSAALESWTWQGDRRVRLFGLNYPPASGYPIASAIGIATFEHVAIAEETAFRGYFQSAFARRYGEDRGWVFGSLLFGAMHAPNALFMDDGAQRLRYLLAGVPFITVLGSYLGLTYRWNGYSLAAPVAIHFWYDLLVSAASFVTDPQHNPLSGSIAIPF